MPFITRQVAAVAAVFALSTGPALASATPSSTGAVKAKTALTAKIAYETPFVEVRYSRNYGGLGRNAVVTDDAALTVSRIPADSAQLPEKWEWVLGADLQQRADNIIAYGEHEEVYHHPTDGKRLVDEGVADLRLSNYFFANADSLLGVRHPKYMAAPYQPYKNKPVKTTTPLIAKAPKPTLAGMIAMGTPLLKQTLPEHILNTYLRRNQAAADYYSLAVARMHVDQARRSAQRDWVEGVRTLGRGDRTAVPRHHRRAVRTHPPAGDRQTRDPLRACDFASRRFADQPRRCAARHPPARANGQAADQDHLQVLTNAQPRPARRVANSDSTDLPLAARVAQGLPYRPPVFVRPDTARRQDAR